MSRAALAAPGVPVPRPISESAAMTDSQSRSCPGEAGGGGTDAGGETALGAADVVAPGPPAHAPRATRTVVTSLPRPIACISLHLARRFAGSVLSSSP